MLQEHPGEIEADLTREYGLDIADWYRGDISSRNVLNKIVQLSDHSKFKKTQDWPPEWELLAEIINAVNALRADLVPGTRYKPIVSPGVEREQEAKRAQARACHDDLIAQMRGGKRR